MEEISLNPGNIFYICDVLRKSYFQKDYLENFSSREDEYHMCDIDNQCFAIRKYADCPYLWKVDESDESEGDCDVESELKCHCFTDYEKRPFACDRCNLRFPYKSSLERHLRRPAHYIERSKIRDKRHFIEHHLKSCYLYHRKERPHVCEFCNKRFTTKSTLSKHVSKVHYHDQRLVCSVCNRTFKDQTRLQRHILFHTEKLKICDVCNKKFTDETKFENHYATHLNLTYVCHVCDKSFSSRPRFKRHQKRHINEPSECAICHKSYTNKYYFKMHYISHFTGKKQYECDLCDASFYAKSNLDGHYRIHTKERPFACEVCGKRFALKSTLGCHYLMHTKEKRFKCTVCQKLFGRSTHLKAHFMAVHTDERPHACELCDRRFALRATLSAHIACAHTNQEKKYKCPECGKGFTRKHKVKIHLLTHTKEKPHQCEICFKCFTQKSSLKTHYRIHERENQLLTVEIRNVDDVNCEIYNI